VPDGRRVAAVQPGRGRRRPDDVVERPLDPLGREVRERTRQVEEELRACPLRPLPGAEPPRFPARGEVADDEQRPLVADQVEGACVR